MKRLLFSLLDSKSGKFGDVIPCSDESEATRGVILGLRSGKPLYAQFPEDYSLYCVGHFDAESGVLVSYPSPKHVCAVGTLISAAGVIPGQEARNA